MKNRRIIFVEVPQSLGDEIQSLTGKIAESFRVDPSIPLPIELETDEESADDDNADPKSPAEKLAEHLSWEMILSGMLRVISAGEYASFDFVSDMEIKPHWLNYYRHFILIIKPEIYNEFTSAAIIKSRNRDFDTAIEIITALEGLFPMSPEVLLNKALIHEDAALELERKGSEMEAALEYDRALEVYKKALDIEPVLPELYFNLGFFYSRTRKFTESKEYFSEYILVSEDPVKKEKAEKIIRDIESQGLDDYNYIQSLELIRQGKEEKALPLIRDFIEEHPKAWNAWFVLGWALRKLGRWKDALESFRKALDLGGTTLDTRNETAICLMELGDFSGAGKELETALREEPENLKIISNLGMLAMKKGDKKEAAGFFRTVLDINPKDPIALKFFAGP